MCGIVGFASVRHTVNRELLERQRDTMVHRGPDSAGTWISDSGHVGFGHRRLAIIDLSPGGHQPMVDAITGNVITFNGEIYNFRELRAELERAGERFSTSSDTEVLLAAYRVWGLNGVRRLDGMFAFAIYDAKLQRVLMARDRAGEKPLYYRVSDGTITFASELKALLSDPSLARRIDEAALDDYLAYGYVSGDRCIVAGVSKLPPAHQLVFDLARGDSHISTYWTLPTIDEAFARHIPDAPETIALTNELDEVLQGSVARQLIADVPIGVLLSGGLDSSLVTAIAARQSSQPLRTFTVSMAGSAAHDEAPYARLVAKHVGSRHTELLADPSGEDVLPALIRQFDEPFADSSMIPTYMVSRAIREHATVAVGGDGGDELFGGYLRHPLHVRQDALRRRIPGVVRQLAAAGAQALPSTVKGRTFAMNLAGDIGDSVASAGRLFNAQERAQLVASLGSTQNARAETERRNVAGAHRSTLHRSTATDFLRYMPDDILVKVDRSSMLTSLEVRAPLLDRAVIEFAFGRLPDALRATGTGRKLILRALAQRYLPADLDVTRKQGFSIPLGEWLGSTWRGSIDEVLDHGTMLDARFTRQLLGVAQRSKVDADRAFTVLAFELWRREYQFS